MSRRSFLKLGFGAAGLAVLGTTAVAIKNVLNQPTQRVIHVEMAENLDHKQAIQAIVQYYNAWLHQASPQEISRKGRAVEVFTTLYNLARTRMKEETLPELTAQEFNQDNIIPKLHAIADALSTDDYYVRLLPTAGAVEETDMSFTFVSVISGKVVRRESAVAERDGKSAMYTHIVIDTEQPTDSMDQYVTAYSNVAAMTYKRRAGDPMYTVLQVGSFYQEGARVRYERMLGANNAPQYAASRSVLQSYKNLPKDEALKKITDRMMVSSLAHEEQHVLV